MRRIVNQHLKNDNQKESDASGVFYASLRRQECDNQKNMQHIDIVLEKEDEKDKKRKKINNDKLNLFRLKIIASFQRLNMQPCRAVSLKWRSF